MAENKRPKDLFPTDKWQLTPSLKQPQILEDTVVEYRRLCRALESWMHKSG